MKKCLIYSIVIYLLLIMFINLQKPSILYDKNDNIKSINYFKYKLKYGFNSIEECVCMPIVALLCALISAGMAKKLTLD